MVLQAIIDREWPVEHALHVRRMVSPSGQWQGGQLMSRHSTAILALAIAIVMLAVVVWRLNSEIGDLKAESGELDSKIGVVQRDARRQADNLSGLRSGGLGGPTLSSLDDRVKSIESQRMMEDMFGYR